MADRDQDPNRKRIDLAVELTKLAEILRRQPLSLPALDAYVDELERFELEEARQALQWCRGNMAFFPAPVEIKDQIYAIRRREEGDRKALAPAPEPPQDREAVRKSIREWIAQLDGTTPPAPEMREPTPEEQEQHRQRQELAREQLSRLEPA